MRYEGAIFRPPSEADAFILQATIGCSWNHCTYCHMYPDKIYRVRKLSESLEDIDTAGQALGTKIEKMFVADGDALAMPVSDWMPILRRAKERFPHLRRVSSYAMARNVLEKTDSELKDLFDAGLRQLYIGPESGDDTTLKRIAKGDDAAAHVEAARRAKKAGMKLSVIALLGIGQDRAKEHAQETAKLITRMNPEFFSALTVTVVPGTPLAKQAARGKFKVPQINDLLLELRWMVAGIDSTDTVFRTNHASNYLPLEGRLPKDREKILGRIDMALNGQVALRSEWMRGL
jgi:radical SAM superfamily enzyme YgiQ (UPF0313 family)